MNESIRVLLVDDSDSAAATRAVLEREDERFTVVTTPSASAGLDRLAEDDIDCIVSAYDVTGMDGIEFLETVREDRPDIPFILFTGAGGEAVASEAISAGVTDYVRNGSSQERYELLADRIANAVSQHRAERETVDTERRLRALAGATKDVLWMVARDWSELLFINSAYEDIWGRSADVLADDPADFLNGVAPEDRDRVEAAMETLSNGESVDLEFRVNAEEDYQRWVWVQGEPIYDDAGELVHIAGFARDITDRRERKRRLEKLQERTRALMHTPTKRETAQVAVEISDEVLGAPLSGFHLVADDEQTLEAIAFVDGVHEELGVSRTYDRTAESDPAADVVWDVFERGEPLVIDDVREYDRLAEATPARSGIIYPLADHGVFIVSSPEPNALDDTDKALVDILASSLTTALDRAEREHELRRQNERLERFTSIVSHDLRTPLNVAEGHLELGMEECESDDLDEVAHALDRMDALIEDLLVLAREGVRVGEVAPVDLAATVESCWRNVESTEASLLVETNVTIEADHSRLQELLENLMRNAVEHGGDDVSITVGDLDDGAGFYVADDGPGIPEDEREQVFEPGFSTSEDGTGFGLSIVHEIADAHGWETAVTDSADGGTRFEIAGVELATT